MYGPTTKSFSMWVGAVAACIALAPAGAWGAGMHAGRAVSFDTLAAECGACHQEKYQQWRYGAGADLDSAGNGSYHAMSATENVYKTMLGKMQPDMQAYCKGCHEAGNAWAVQDKVNGIPQPRTTNVEEGVHCVTCHFDGRKVVSKAAMQDPLFCATCHNESTGLVEIYDEWLADYRGGKTCQQCHMADGNHAAPGFHSPSFIGKALAVAPPVISHTITAGVPFTFRFGVTNSGTGHSVPEDLFRVLTVRASIVDGANAELYECVNTYYKRNALFGENPADTVVIKSGATATLDCPGAVVGSPGVYTVRIEVSQDSNRVDPTLNHNAFMTSAFTTFVAR